MWPNLYLESGKSQRTLGVVSAYPTDGQRYRRQKCQSFGFPEADTIPFPTVLRVSTGARSSVPDKEELSAIVETVRQPAARAPMTATLCS